MTAEVAVLNRRAVALATDSAVTSGNKIYESANKLFRLSKYHPIGVMIHGGASFMGIPWEIIIKEFRKVQKDTERDYLAEYVEDFFNFLSDSRKTILDNNITKEYTKDVYRLAALKFFNTLGTKIEKSLRRKLSSSQNEATKITEQLIEDTVREEVETMVKIKQRYEREKENVSVVSAADLREEINDRSRLLQEARKSARENKENHLNHPINDSLLPAVEEVVNDLIIKNWQRYSGVVFAGYGKQEYFPYLARYNIEAFYNDKLKCARVEELSDGAAAIVPFAQREMVDRMIRGVDPLYERVVRDHLSVLLKNYAKVIGDTLQEKELLESGDASGLVSTLEAQNEDIIRSFFEKLSHQQQTQFINPIINNLDNLPKDELAIVAKTLVNITSFKRKVSVNEAETVSGPVDLAIISKGDGFIWIQRKHYFEPELNHQFFANYFKH